jgi:D-specific alpha-keto acid dehydrogenase
MGVDQHPHDPMLRGGHISSTYRQPHTRWQHGAALTGGMTHSSALTVYACEPPEAAFVREIAPHCGVTPTITEAALSEATVDLALGSRCVSVGHKTTVPGAVLLSLRRAGVSYLSTRSVGYDHIDMRAARGLGISIGNVAYSPDSVALLHRACATGHGRADHRQLPDTDR